MFRGYRNHLIDKTKTNTTTTINNLPHIAKCSKCQKFNPIVSSFAATNIQTCIFCAQPFYIIKQ